MNNLILQLRTAPPICMGQAVAGLTRYRKELISTGHYEKASTGQSFDVTLQMIDDMVSEFKRWTAAGNKVPIPLGHDSIDNAAMNRGWVTDMWREGNSLYGIMELSDPELAKTSDVSIAVSAEVIDGKGLKYRNMVSHVALCTDPVVGGLKGFEVLSLSLKGENKMNLLTKLAAWVGIKKENPTEDEVMLALEAKVKPPQVVAKVDDGFVDPVARLMGENREMRLSGLVKAGIITPAVKDLIAARYVDAKAVALELSRKEVACGFDLLYNVLVQNRPVKLDEITGAQTMELSNLSAAKSNPMKADVNRRRRKEGLKEV